MAKKVHRVLLTNDDGLDAPGIVLLESVAKQLAEEVWIVAPATDRSGVSNSISLREPVRVTQQGPQKFAVHGTPADCVAVALRHIMAGSPPDLILSGINLGSNIGFETVLSGTVGAGISGTLLAIPSIALSQVKEQDAKIDWSVAERYALETISQLLDLQLQKECCLNVNFPDVAVDRVKGLKVTSQGMGKVTGLKVTPVPDPYGDEYFWIRVEHGELPKMPGSELEAVQEGYISVTPLSFERTSQEGKAQLLEQLKS